MRRGGTDALDRPLTKVHMNQEQGFSPVGATHDVHTGAGWKVRPHASEEDLELLRVEVRRCLVPTGSGAIGLGRQIRQKP